MTRFKAALAVFLCLAALGSPLRGENPSQDDFQKHLSALTNRARIYELRAAAMSRLMQIDSAQAYSAFLSLLADPEEDRPLRVLASEKMKEIDPDRCLNDLGSLFDDRGQDSFARQIAIGVLASGNAFGIEKKIRSVMHDRGEDPAIRNYALGLFGRGSAPDKVPVLRSFVTDKTETLAVRNNALFSLEALEDRAFVEESVRSILLAGSEPDEFRKNCVLIAERLGQPELFNVLASVVVSRRNSAGLKRLSLSALKRAGEPGVLERLKQAYAYETDPALSREIQDTIESIQSRDTTADK
ncbi:MAG: hypothetical protein HY714_06670 [Candidatus Omnitrophica bacterium]|nr:hypothetical protein [Candidatus Omnitrophota bacterium]